MLKTYLAPAKINLCLHVLGKRADGYHELAMLMQRISLYDRIGLRLSSKPGITIRCAGLDLQPNQENIAARAARALLDAAGVKSGVEIEIDKQIPVAAGLGGGSSNAATVLMGLNEMLGLGLGNQALRKIAVILGADVPFFIFGRPAWATGIGDVLEEVVGLPRVWYVLVNPGIAVSTAWVYGNLRLTSPRPDLKIPRFSGAPQEAVAVLHNDLERVTIPRHPQIGEVKEVLLAAGASGALMSGSGSSVFGVFTNQADALRAAQSPGLKRDWKVFVVQPVQGVGTISG